MGKSQKIQFEYIVNVSPKFLFNFLSTPSGLAEWFADDVNINDKSYLFRWGDDEQEAKIISKIQDVFIRFRWLDAPPDTYFEFKIMSHELTNDTALIITDFAESERQVKEARLLWDRQVNDLRSKIGTG